MALPLCSICVRAKCQRRTRDLQLRRHFRSVPGRCWAWPDAPFRYSDNGWMCPDVSRCLWPLAPRLAPRDLVSIANVRMLRAGRASIRDSGQRIRVQLDGQPHRTYRRRRLLPVQLRDAWTPRTGPAAIRAKSPHPVAMMHSPATQRPAAKVVARSALSGSHYTPMRQRPPPDSGRYLCTHLCTGVHNLP